MADSTGTNGTSSEASDETPPISAIAPHGDLVVRISHTGSTAGMETHSFLVSTAALRSNSKYFSRLLETGRFGEGEHIAARHAELRSKYPNPAAVPSLELPTISIEELGRISHVKSLSSLLTDFLSILHSLDLATNPPPVANLANLAIVADRFDALPSVQAYVHRKKTFQTLEAKTPPKTELALPHERTRQRLLVALLLDCPLWVERYSLRLVSRGWTLASPDFEIEPTEPLWWDLPFRMEEELLFRRQSILQTIQSLQSHFLALYASRTRQCRLGYDSSPECDSFQFGEMVRFFTRSGTLSLQPLIAQALDSSEPLEGYTGDIPALLEKLKQVPEYQVNSHHSHCGIRTRLVPLLDLIGLTLQHAGVCGECWAKDRRGEMWMDAKRPLVWKKAAGSGLILKSADCAKRHAGVRDMFLAGERLWD